MAAAREERSCSGHAAVTGRRRRVGPRRSASKTRSDAEHVERGTLARSRTLACPRRGQWRSYEDRPKLGPDGVHIEHDPAERAVMRLVRELRAKEVGSYGIVR